MTKKYNKETGKFEPITKPEDLPAVSWAEVMSCGGDKERRNRLWEKGEREKEATIKEMKKRGKNSIEDYYIIKKEMGL